MESFEIMYRGKKLQGTKSAKGKIVIQLPERRDPKGNIYMDTIERISDGWLYTSSNLNDPEYFGNIWLYDDFTMAKNNNSQNQIKTATKKFDPNMQVGKSLINDQCKVIYEIVGKMLEYELFGMSGEEILNLRKEWLTTSLQILGYSSTDRVKEELNNSAGYMALGMIHHQLGGIEYEMADGVETVRDCGIKNIGAYVHQKDSSDKDKKYGIHIPKNTDRAALKSMVERLRSYVQANKEFIEEQDGTDGKDGKLELIRSILPDYCFDMKDKIPEEQWRIYSKVVSNTAKTLLAINYDIVPELDRTNIIDATQLDDLDFEHLIGLIIDTNEAAIACSIDDVFVMSETARVEERAKFLIDDSERVKTSSVGAALHFLREQALMTRKKKEKHYEEFDELDKKCLHTGFWNPENKGVANSDKKVGRGTDDDNEEFEY